MGLLFTKNWSENVSSLLPFYFSRQCSRKKTTVEENIYAEAWFAELSSELFQTTKMEFVEKIVDGF